MILIKYLHKIVTAPDDLRTDDPVALQHLIEGLFMVIQQKTRDLHRVTGNEESCNLNEMSISISNIFYFIIIFILTLNKVSRLHCALKLLYNLYTVRVLSELS